MRDLSEDNYLEPTRLLVARAIAPCTSTPCPDLAHSADPTGQDPGVHEALEVLALLPLLLSACFTAGLMPGCRLPGRSLAPEV
jgi:hypothetical protein